MANIFVKVCPQCALGSLTSASTCPCGYVFEADLAANCPPTVEEMVRQEALYEEYLRARAAQAAQAAREASEQAERDPANPGKAAAAVREQQAAAKAQQELSAQSSRIAALRTQHPVEAA